MNIQESIFSDAGKLRINYLPHLSVDCVILGYHEKQMKILCTEIKGINSYMLPGGFIKKDENMDDAAYRILEERTGVKGVFLKQFKTYGHATRSRDLADNLKNLLQEHKVKPAEIKWILDRFVSVGYYALTEFSKVDLKNNFSDSTCQWFGIHSLPHLILDHAEMVKDAQKTLQLQIHNEPIGYNLLTAKFTLPELQALYETILDKKLDQRNFTKKLVSLDIIRKLNEKKDIGGHRSPSLYKFNKRNYNKALKDGVALAF